MPLDPPIAERFARLALDGIRREYPNKIAHTLESDADVRPPRELTPAFYGCYDWHSAVHSHWTLARIARTFPHTPLAEKSLAALASNITAENIAAEVRYLEPRNAFERPYGLAWLLTLSAELRAMNSPLAPIIEPLENAAAQKLEAWLAKLPYPDRSGQHSNTAFALGLMFDWARQQGHDRDALPFASAVRFYNADHNGPIAYEPSGEDFLSPCLAEADLMRRVCTQHEFSEWLTAFLPDFPMLRPVTSADPADGKLTHFDGLNLSRAWMLFGIAKGLPDNDPRRLRLLLTADAHRHAGLAAVTEAHYEGAHWLGTFAVYLETMDLEDRPRGLRRVR
ncbi:MAG: DUF2891 domain-containing protein [Acidobacteriota bacterium]|nr:DUF2891 domain-containing protein [Acidobacteriota bacterium]